MFVCMRMCVHASADVFVCLCALCVCLCACTEWICSFCYLSTCACSTCWIFRRADWYQTDSFLWLYPCLWPHRKFSTVLPNVFLHVWYGMAAISRRPKLLGFTWGVVQTYIHEYMYMYTYATYVTYTCIHSYFRIRVFVCACACARVCACILIVFCDVTDVACHRALWFQHFQIQNLLQFCT